MGFDSYDNMLLKIKIIYKPYIKMTIPLMLLFQLIYAIVWKISPLTEEGINSWVDNFLASTTGLEKFGLLILLFILGFVYVLIFIVTPIEITEWYYKNYKKDSEYTKRLLEDG